MSRSMSRFLLATWLLPGKTPNIYELVNIYFAIQLSVSHNSLFSFSHTLLENRPCQNLHNLF
jgi:hypothetical protein